MHGGRNDIDESDAIVEIGSDEHIDGVLLELEMMEADGRHTEARQRAADFLSSFHSVIGIAKVQAEARLWRPTECCTTIFTAIFEGLAQLAYEGNLFSRRCHLEVGHAGALAVSQVRPACTTSSIAQNYVCDGASGKQCTLGLHPALDGVALEEVEETRIRGTGIILRLNGSITRQLVRGVFHLLVPTLLHETLHQISRSFRLARAESQRSSQALRGGPQRWRCRAREAFA
jgi:hypothetical protein